MNQLYHTQQKNINWLTQAIQDITNAPGHVYLIHLHTPLGQPQTPAQRAHHGLPPRQAHYTPHAQHYLGWTTNLPARIQAHTHGHGAKFMAAAHRQNIPFQIVRVWPGGPDLETTLKRRKNNRHLCPHCAPHPIQPTLFELTPEAITDLLIPF